MRIINQFTYIIMSRLHNAILSVAMCFLAILLPSCKRLVETPVPTNLVSENAVYANDATAISVLTGLYYAMNTAPFQGSLTNGSISLFGGLSSDEFTLAPGVTDSRYVGHYQNALTQSNAATMSGGEHYPCYTMVYLYVMLLLKGWHRQKQIH